MQSAGATGHGLSAPAGSLQRRLEARKSRGWGWTPPGGERWRPPCRKRLATAWASTPNAPASTTMPVVRPLEYTDSTGATETYSAGTPSFSKKIWHIRSRFSFGQRAGSVSRMGVLGSSGRTCDSCGESTQQGWALIRFLVRGRKSNWSITEHMSTCARACRRWCPTRVCQHQWNQQTSHHRGFDKNTTHTWFRRPQHQCFSSDVQEPVCPRHQHRHAQNTHAHTRSPIIRSHTRTP